MNGIHDMGGMQGFGAIPFERNEPVFHAESECRVFALERMHPTDCLTALYYERWLHTLVELSVAEGLFSRDELERRCRDIRDEEASCRS